MKAKHYVGVLACLAGFAGTAGATTPPPGQACSVQPDQQRRATGKARVDKGLPRVKVPRQRCIPAPARHDTDCANNAEARRPNPPPPAGTEPSFGDVPMAAVVPPSAPFSGEVPPGPAPVPPKRKTGCPAHPAS